MSGRKLQGRRRQEVIEKWLQGIEDPEWQVKPTKTEGKYIISERRAPPEEPVSDPPEREEGEEPEPDREPEEGEEPPAEKPKPPPPAPKPKHKPVVYPRQKLPKSAFNDDLGIEILTELRAMGEAKRAKEAKKQLKKDIRRQVRKHIPPPPPEPTFGDSDEYEYEDEAPPQPIYPQRRRVNLMRRA
jgi:hypothetical protein